MEVPAPRCLNSTLCQASQDARALTTAVGRVVSQPAGPPLLVIKTRQEKLAGERFGFNRSPATRDDVLSSLNIYVAWPDDPKNHHGRGAESTRSCIGTVHTEDQSGKIVIPSPAFKLC